MKPDPRQVKVAAAVINDDIQFPAHCIQSSDARSAAAFSIAPVGYYAQKYKRGGGDGDEKSDYC